ncbi:MAG: hypothetical protein ABII22_04365 [Candidatus Micrarchaeota archaeon]
MKRVYECDIVKKKEMLAILEADPYAEDSFARIGYKLKEGAAVGEDEKKLYIYLSASEDFIKKADAKLKEMAKPADCKVEQRVVEKIEKEEESAESGLGDIFG